MNDVTFEDHHNDSTYQEIRQTKLISKSSETNNVARYEGGIYPTNRKRLKEKKITNTLLKLQLQISPKLLIFSMLFNLIIFYEKRVKIKYRVFLVSNDRVLVI